MSSLDNIVTRLGQATAQAEEATAAYKGAIMNVGYKLYRAFESAVTLTQVNEAVQFSVGGIFYRWDGVFPQGGLVIPQNTPEPSPDQTGSGKYMAVLDLEIKEAAKQIAATISGKQYASVDDMVAGTPLSTAIGEILRTGSTVWRKDTSGSPVTIANFRALNAVNPIDFGARFDGVTDDTVALKSAAAIGGELFLPAGRCVISDTIDIIGSVWGCGSATEIRPNGSFPAFNIKTGASGKSQAGVVGNFAIDYQSVSSPTSNAIGLWLSKGTGPTATSGNNNVEFCNIFIFKAYRGIQKLSTDTGNLWNCIFRNVLILGSVDRGIYIDTTNSNGSLNVSFDTVTCDGFDSVTAKGAFIRGISNLKFFGISTANTGGNLSALWVSDCTNVDVRLQIENINTTTPISQGLVGFTNCPSVELAIVSQTCKFNHGAGNSAYYVYLDANVKSFVLNNFAPSGDVYTSGTTKFLNVNSGAPSEIKISVVDPKITKSDIYAAAGVVAGIYFQNTNYSLEKNSNTRRVTARNVACSVNTLTDILSTESYDGVTAKPSGIYLVQGVFSGDSSIGFTDLVMVASAGNTQQKAVTVSSTFFGANHARAYSINANKLAVTISHTSGTYKVSATGVDQVGSF